MHAGTFGYDSDARLVEFAQGLPNGTELLTVFRARADGSFHERVQELERRLLAARDDSAFADVRLLAEELWVYGRERRIVPFCSLEYRDSPVPKLKCTVPFDDALRSVYADALGPGYLALGFRPYSIVMEGVQGVNQPQQAALSDLVGCHYDISFLKAGFSPRERRGDHQVYKEFAAEAHAGSGELKVYCEGDKEAVLEIFAQLKGLGFTAR